jgi:mRNA interferase MazF
LTAGQILWIDFRRDAAPKEANKLRPGIVVEESGLFAAAFPNVVVVPCTTTLTFEVRDLCVQIAPDERNGFDRINWAIAHNVTTASKARIVKQTDYYISLEHLEEIRACIMEMLGR